MAYTVTGSSRTPVGATTGYSTTDPVTGSITINSGDELVVALIINSGTGRTGGAPTLGGYTMAQADTSRAGLTSPEISAEMWYITASGINLPSIPLSATDISLPNTGAGRTVIDMVTAKTKPGKTAYLQVATGSANATTSTNPYCRITTTAGSTVIFEVVANGANSWSPTARTLNWVNINDNDIGVYGGGMQYIITDTVGVVTGSWTFGTAEDWGVVMAAFGEGNAPIYLNNATQAQTSDNIELVYYPFYNLEMQDASQAQTSDNIDLSQIYMISVFDSKNTQTSDNVDLTQNYLISIFDSKNTQTSDNVTLTPVEPTPQAIADNANQIQTSDNISLIQNQVLGMYNAVQIQTTGDISLTQHYVLSAYSATQIQSSDNIVLTQNYAYLLQMYNCSQIQTSDNITLIQNYILVVMVATQLQVSSNITLGSGGVTKQMIHYIMMRRR